MQAEDLAQLRLFAGVKWSAVSDELAPCKVVTLRDAQVVSAPPAANDSVWFVLTGALRTRLSNMDDPILTTGPSEAVGAWDAIEVDRRARWVVAQGPTTAIAVPLDVFKALLQRHPVLRSNLWREAVRRIRFLESETATARDDLETLRRQATRDALTGMYNRRWLEDQLGRLSQTASGKRLSVVMIDVDHFKRLNDTLGHAMGDVVLVGVAQTLRRRFRPADLVSRYGGEEFAVLMPNTDLAAAEVAADRVRRAIEFTRFAAPDGLVLPQVTVSCGVAELREEEDGSALLSRADQALYAAKQAGRNRVLRG